MATTGKLSLPDHVTRAIADIEELHRIGGCALRGRSFTKWVSQNPHLAASFNVDTLRKCRAFADPVNGYAPDELRDLIDQLRKHKYANSTWKFGRTHIIRLISVPKAGGERRRMQQNLITNEWSCSELDDAIRRRYLPRKQGGRRRNVPQDLDALLSQILQECIRWQRWVVSLTRCNEEGVSPSEHLMKPVRRYIKQINNSVGELMELVETQHLREARKS